MAPQGKKDIGNLMKKLINLFTVLALLAALSACAANDTSATAVPATSLPAKAAATQRPAASVTPYPTPTRAPSITPIASSTAQPSVTALPKAAGGAVKAATPTPKSTDVTGDGSFGCSNASVVKDVTIPDGTQMNPGQAFEKTWKFFNTGTCAWPGSTTLKFIKGDDMQPSPGMSGSLTDVNNKVDVSVGLVAPYIAGKYKAYFRLADKNGNAFGPLVFVSIVVTSSSSSQTPKP